MARMDQGRVVCSKCGVVLIEGVQVDAIAGTCPKCNRAFSYPIIGLEIGSAARASLARAIVFIQACGGWGRLIIEFQKGRAVRVGLGESMEDVRGKG